MIKCLIFDLDDTLIDTAAIKPFRDRREWDLIRQHYSYCQIIPKSLDILNIAKSFHIKIAIVTNSPRNYAQDILRFFQIQYDVLVTFNDVRIPKPSPEGIFSVLQRLNLTNQEVICIGNSSIDKEAAIHAGTFFVEINQEIESKQHHQHGTHEHLAQIIADRLSRQNNDISYSKLINNNHFF